MHLVQNRYQRVAKLHRMVLRDTVGQPPKRNAPFERWCGPSARSALSWPRKLVQKRCAIVLFVEEEEVVQVLQVLVPPRRLLAELLGKVRSSFVLPSVLTDQWRFYLDYRPVLPTYRSSWRQRDTSYPRWLAADPCPSCLCKGTMTFHSRLLTERRKDPPLRRQRTKRKQHRNFTQNTGFPGF